MPTIHIAIDIGITDDDQKLLLDTFGCVAGDVEAEVGRYAVAAVREYLEMFTGAGITTATDIRERRLVLLLLTRFAGNPPDADLVARLFNITPTSARNLLRSVAAKHRLRLRTALHDALMDVLSRCQRPGKAGPYTLVETNAVLVELLNDRLAASPKPMVKIKLMGDGMTEYEVKSDSYDYLKTAV